MQRKVEYVYHWNRIFGAAAILSALIGLVALGLLRWLSESPETAEVAITTDVEIAQAAAAVPVKSASRPELEHERLIESATIEPPVSSQNANKVTVIQTKSEIASSDKSDEKPTAPSIDAHDLAIPMVTPSTVTEQAPASVTVTQSFAGEMGGSGLLPPTASGTQVPAKDEPVKMDRGLLSLQSIAKRSPVVKRFVLAKSVTNLEPKGDIEDIVFDSRGITAIYCFSEVIGREHPTLEYVWQRNNKVVARVNASVRGERWRSYSSKVLNRRMQGNWRVELRGKNNELLAVAVFVLWKGRRS